MTALSDLIAKLEAAPTATAVWCSSCDLLVLDGEVLRSDECDSIPQRGTAQSAANALKVREAAR